MLGRLFKNQAQQPVQSHNIGNGYSHLASTIPTTSPVAGVASNSFEDSYTRETLYGTPTPFKPFQLTPKTFRIVVSQDGGNLRQKQILFDSAVEGNKRHRFHSDLNDFMFGAGLPLNELNDQIKVHLLQNLVLITRLFLISGDDEEDISRESSLDEAGGWNPTSTIRGEISKRSKDPSKCTNTRDTIILNTNTTQSMDALSNKNKICPTTSKSTIYPTNNLYSGPTENIQRGGFEIGKNPITCNRPTKNWDNGHDNDLNQKSKSLHLMRPSLLHSGGVHIDNGNSSEDTSEGRPVTLCTNNTLSVGQTKVCKTVPNGTQKLGTLSIYNGSPLNRFAIGIVIPVDTPNDLNDIVFNNWEEFSNFIYVLQKSVSRRLLEHLNTQNNQFIINRRIQFPNYILQNETDLHTQLVKLAKLAHYGANVPRLAPTQALLGNEENRTTLVNWILEVMNWMEFKDGKLGFLVSLFALLRTHSKLLARKNYDTEPLTVKNKETTRLVIMTGNPVVAKKLAFIISAFIGFDMDNVDFVDTVAVSERDNKSEFHRNSHFSIPLSPVSESIDLSPENMISLSLGLSPVNDLCHSPHSSSALSQTPDNISHSPRQNLFLMPKNHSRTEFSQSPKNMYSVSPRNIASQVHQGPPKPGFHDSPQRIKKASSFSSSVSLDHSLPSARGWEIPCKLVALTSSVLDGPNMDTLMGNHTTTTVKGIPIARPVTATASSGNLLLLKSSSMSYLSLSLSLSSKFGSSFFEKWKSSLGSNNFDDYNDDPTLSKRHSTKLFRAPSPAVEIDELNWHQLFIDDNNRDTYRWVETNKWADNTNKLSRTQSMFDLCDKKPTTPQLQRTKTSIRVPIIMSRDVQVDHNQDIIRKKCEKIIGGDVSWKQGDESTMEVDFDFSEGPAVHYKALLPNVAFSDEFRPEYGIQSCPVNSKLESQVMAAMKNDLQFYQNRYTQVLSRTIFISLRAREIKVIEMNLNGDSGQYKTRIKKVFTTAKNCGDRIEIAKVEDELNEIQRLFADQQIRKADGEDFEKSLRNVVMNLVNIKN